MRGLLTAVTLGTTLLCGAAARAEGPVVVELFTSQGCSSCPPADAVLKKLAGHEGVLPLALHVDYWDYIGWEDTFGDPAHSERQKRYARAVGERMIYTPQMIVGGTERMVGTEPMALMDAIDAQEDAPDPVTLEVSRSGALVTLRAERADGSGHPLVVQLVRYDPHETVAIEHGENAGLEITYANIVTSWQVLDSWSGEAPYSREVRVDGNAPAAVIVQEEGPGRVVAAARVPGK